MALTTETALAWLSATLTGDATLMALGSPPLSTGVRVYRDLRPEGTATPALVFSLASPGVPLKVIGNVTVWSEIVAFVRGIDQSPALSALYPIMARVETVLEGASGAAAGGTVFYCASEQEFQDQDTTQGGPKFQYIGRYWRLYCR